MSKKVTIQHCVFESGEEGWGYTLLDGQDRLAMYAETLDGALMRTKRFLLSDESPTDVFNNVHNK